MARKVFLILAIVATCISAFMAAIVVLLFGGAVIDVYLPIYMFDWSNPSDLIMLLLLYAPLPLWLAFILIRFAK